MLIAVKPDNPSVLFIGGTNLYRSTDGFTSTTNTEWIGGYSKNSTQISFNLPTHPDIHNLVFDPTNPIRAICANDGGIQITDDIMTSNPIPNIVTWANLNNYQTLQYYRVALDRASKMNFIGLLLHGLSAFFVYGEIVGARLLVAIALALGVEVALIAAAITLQLITNFSVVTLAVYLALILGVILLQAIPVALILVFTVIGSRANAGFLPLRDCPYFVSHVEKVN